VFKLTENRVPLGHVTDIQSRPDYTAAFDKHWGKEGVTFWLAGGKASKGKSKEGQTKQAIYICIICSWRDQTSTLRKDCSPPKLRLHFYSGLEVLACVASRSDGESVGGVDHTAELMHAALRDAAAQHQAEQVVAANGQGFNPQLPYDPLLSMMLAQTFDLNGIGPQSYQQQPHLYQ